MCGRDRGGGTSTTGERAEFAASGKTITFPGFLRAYVESLDEGSGESDDTEKRLPQFPDVPTFKEIGLDWVDGAYRGIGVPKSTSPEVRKQVSDMMDAINKDPAMRKQMIEGGFEVTTSAGRFESSSLVIATGRVRVTYDVRDLINDATGKPDDQLKAKLIREIGRI